MERRPGTPLVVARMGANECSRNRLRRASVDDLGSLTVLVLFYRTFEDFTLRDSKAWKKGVEKFQWLENIESEFPSVVVTHEMSLANASSEAA